MLIQEKKGHLDSLSAEGRSIDWLQLEWYETGKRILRRKTIAGKEVSLKFLNENPKHAQGDVLFEDEHSIIAVSILPCNCLLILPKNMFEMACVCYEIGNRHLPLFYDKEQLLVPFEKPLFQLLLAQGYLVEEQTRQLLQPLNSSVAGHEHGNGETLFSKIMKLTSPA